METNNFYDKSIYPNDLTSILILIFYLPIGVCLLIIRLIIILILLLTNNLNNSSILCKTLGLSISSSLSIRKDEEEKERIVLISNHVTLFDYLVLKKIIKNLNIHEENYNYENNCYLNKILLSRIETKKKNDDDVCSLCVFPEIKMTNGKYGLLDFNKDIIESIINSKQFDILIPVCLKVNHHHLLPFSVNYNNSSTIQFIITLFTPTISYKIELLNSIKLNDNQQPHNGQELSKELQKIIALNLGLKCFNNPLNEEDYHTNKLIRQISDILPDFKIDQIKEHVKEAQTRDIDSLITGLLEKSSSKPMIIIEEKKKIVKTIKKPLTYNEQKELLIEEARKRYLSKHTI
jgi:hypothetical protein